MSMLSTPHPRRGFLSASAGLSAGAIALLGGAPGLARAASSNPAKDSGILNVALGLEHEAINAYQLGAASGLLQPAVLEVALRFQSHHKAHRDALIATLETLGGKPVAEKRLDEYAQALQANTLKNQADVLRLAARLELGAVNAYLGVIPAFTDTALAKVAGRLAADEAMHWTALTGALGQALPAAGLSFGRMRRAAAGWCAGLCIDLGASLILGPAAAQAQDGAAAGRALYDAHCSACHAIDTNRVGPAHRGVFGRKVGLAPGFKYSQALQRSTLVWDAKTLDAWLTDPERLIPGQQMDAEVDDPAVRAAIIEFLRSQK